MKFIRNYYWNNNLDKFDKILIPSFFFLTCFEFFFVKIFGFDLIFKPYRIISIIISVRLIFHKNIYLDKYDLLHFLYISIGLLLSLLQSIFFNTSFAPTLNVLTHFIIMYVPCIYIKNTIKDIKTLQNLIFVFLVGVYINALYCIFEFYFINTEGFVRSSGFYRNSSHASCVLSVLFFYLVLNYNKRGKGIQKFLFKVINILLVLFAIISTGGKTGVLTVLLSPFVFAFYNWKKVAITVPVFLIISFILLVQLQNDNTMSSVLSRYTLDEFIRGGGRFDIWKSATNLIADTYFIGVGWGQFINYSLEYAQELFSTSTKVVGNFKLVTHNAFLQSIVEFGLFGFFIFLLIHLFFFKDTIKAYQLNGSRELSVFILFVFLATIIYNMTHDAFSSNFIILFYTFLILHYKITYNGAVNNFAK